jgi:hypothetical protein
VPIIGVGRSAWTVDQFQSRAFESLEQHGGVDPVAYEKLFGYLSRPLKSWSSSNSPVLPKWTKSNHRCPPIFASGSTPT